MWFVASLERKYLGPPLELCPSISRRGISDQGKRLRAHVDCFSGADQLDRARVRDLQSDRICSYFIAERRVGSGSAKRSAIHTYAARFPPDLVDDFMDGLSHFVWTVLLDVMPAPFAMTRILNVDNPRSSSCIWSNAAFVALSTSAESRIWFVRIV